jgi:hypothetical protein
MNKINIDTGAGIVEVDLDTVTMSDVDELIANLSVDAGVDAYAKTVLYSGKVAGISTSDIVEKITGIRIINNTPAAKFLTNENGQYNQVINAAIRNEITSGIFDINTVKKGMYETNYNNLSDLLSIGEHIIPDDLDRAIDLARTGYNYEPTRGAWAIVSEHFVRATPITSEIVSLVPEADLTRTWAAVEVPTILSRLSDDHIVGGHRVADLRNKRNSEGIDSVLRALQNDAKNQAGKIELFFDELGSIIGVEANHFVGGLALSGLGSGEGIGAVLSLPYGDYISLPELSEYTSMFPNAVNLNAIDQLLFRMTMVKAQVLIIFSYIIKAYYQM